MSIIFCEIQSYLSLVFNIKLYYVNHFSSYVEKTYKLVFSASSSHYFSFLAIINIFSNLELKICLRLLGLANCKICQIYLYTYILYMYILQANLYVCNCVGMCVCEYVCMYNVYICVHYYKDL